MSFQTVDLFDKIEDSNVHLQPRIVVSTDRIEELTMQKITNNRIGVFDKQNIAVVKNTPRTVHRSVKRTIILIAAIICLFALTCYAVAATLDAGDLFKSYFSSHQENPLSDGQIEYIDNQAATIGESVTHDGVTVTITGAISDGTMAYIWVDITAPVGQKIESLPLGFDVEFDKLKLEGQENDRISSISTSCASLPNHDGLDNTASILIKYEVYQFRGSNFSFTDGKNRILQLRDIHYYETEHPYSLRTVAKGLWEFEFAFSAVDNTEIELLSAPVSASYSQISGNWVDATIFSIQLKGLSAVVYYSLDSNEVQEAGDFGVLKFVMKDGNVIDAYPEKAGQTSQIENGNLISDAGSHYCAYSFAAPINYEDIAALYIGEKAINIKTAVN